MVSEFLHCKEKPSSHWLSGLKSLLEQEMHFSSFWVFNHLRFIRKYCFGNIFCNQDCGILLSSLDLISFWLSEVKHLPEVALGKHLSNIDQMFINDASQYFNDWTSSVIQQPQIFQQSLVSAIISLLWCIIPTILHNYPLFTALLWD